MAIDPNDVTNFERTDAELQEFLLFGVLAVRTNSAVASRGLQQLLDGCPYPEADPFIRLSTWLYSKGWRTGSTWQEVVKATEDRLRECGQRFVRMKARSVIQLCHELPDLGRCSRDRLMQIHGIGWKTASFFLLHSREHERVACLDVHILAWLTRHAGDLVDVPKESPTSAKAYYRLEAVFHAMADLLDRHPAHLDMDVWRWYSKNGDGEHDPAIDLDPVAVSSFLENRFRDPLRL